MSMWTGLLESTCLTAIDVCVDRAPGINVFEYHSQSKAERERSLRLLRRNGGACLTSYGIIVNNSDLLATDTNGRDFVWVRNISDVRIIYISHTHSSCDCDRTSKSERICDRMLWTKIITDRHTAAAAANSIYAARRHCRRLLWMWQCAFRFALIN